jgi:antitoxin (DNA-binding transcriptional repressor) of toxin-antitoxin stability system
MPIVLTMAAAGSYESFMRSVGIKALKRRLSDYLRIAATGEIVLVTERGRVVAELGPPRQSRNAFAGDGLLAEAVREGWVRPPILVAAGPPPRKPVMKLHDLLKDLESARKDR